MKDFTVSFSLADSEYMTALRLAVGAVCAVADADIDGAEDMKVCVTESCLLLKGCGYESVTVFLNCNDGVHATVTGKGGEPKFCDNEFSLALISALVTSCKLEKASDGIINKLVLDL